MHTHTHASDFKGSVMTSGILLWREYTSRNMYTHTHIDTSSQSSLNVVWLIASSDVTSLGVGWSWTLQVSEERTPHLCVRQAPQGSIPKSNRTISAWFSIGARVWLERRKRRICGMKRTTALVLLLILLLKWVWLHHRGSAANWWRMDGGRFNILLQQKPGLFDTGWYITGFPKL